MKNMVRLNDLNGNIFVKIDSHICQNLIKDLLKIEGSYASIGRALGCLDTNVFRIEKTSIININHLKKVCSLLSIHINSLEKKIEAIKSGCRGILVSIKFPIILDYKLAALVGHVIGDGTITICNGFEYTNSDIALINKVKRYVYDKFNCDHYYPRSVKKTNVIVQKIRYPSIIGKILILVGAPKGKKVNQPFDVPLWIKKGNKKEKSAFLQALFDDDGSVEKGHMIVFTNSKRRYLRKEHEKFVSSISSLLSDLGITNQSIRFRIRESEKKNFKANIRITNLRFLELFEKEIGFTHKKRAKRLKELLRNPVRKYTKKKEGDRLIENLLKEKPMTFKEISKKINRSLSNTRRYLYRMEKHNIIERLYPTRHKTEVTWGLKGKRYNKVYIPYHDVYHAIPLILKERELTLSEISKLSNKNESHILRYLREYKNKEVIKRIDRKHQASLWTSITSHSKAVS